MSDSVVEYSRSKLGNFLSFGKDVFLSQAEIKNAISFCTYNNLCTFLYFTSKFGYDFCLSNLVLTDFNQ